MSLRQSVKQPLHAEGKRARKVKTLRVGKMWSVMDRDPQGEYFEVGELIQLCKEGLEEVVVGKLERVRVDGRFVGADTHLRALHFCDSSIDISPQLVLGFRYKAAIIGTRVSPSLSKVRHLTLCDVDANGGTIGFDRLFSLLPNLSSLAAIHSRRPYGCIPPHLKYLHASPLPRELTGWEPPDEDRHPARTERLLELYAVVEQHLARRSPLIGMSCRAEDMRRMQAMRNVPPSVRFLRFTSGHFFGSDFLTPFLSSSDNHLKKLEELVLPMRLSTGAAYEELREWCKKEGVRVVYEKDEEGEGTMWEARFWQCVRRWEKEVEQEES
ncbi:hypothetical protein JCM11251_006829 [Rhodosporidiobolus azoricus]